MRSSLAKMDVKLPDLQEALERGDRSLLLTSISEAFAEVKPNMAQTQAKVESNESSSH